MADDLDLERGDPSRSEPETATQRRRRERREKSGSGDGGGSREEGRVKTEIRSRLDRVFDRIAKSLEARGDDELADVIREDSEAMTQGFVSLTGSFKPLRMPLLMLLNLVEPLLAFGRVARILGRRLVERRATRLAEREAMMADQEIPPTDGEVPAYGQATA